jgi:hypothetical protein
MDKSYDPELGEEGNTLYRNDYGNYKESGVQAACVRTTGACCWVFLGLVAFFGIVSYIPISGVTEAPAYARTLIYMSLGYHFDDVQDAIGNVSPPPPSFRVLGALVN